MKNIKFDEDSSWSRHYDEKFGSWYYFNDLTKESLWEEETEIELSKVQQNSKPAIVKEKKARKELKGFAKYMKSKSNQDHFDDEENLLNPVPEDNPTNDEMRFVRLSLCNAILLEAPLCFLEGLFRVIALMVLFLASYCFNDSWDVSKIMKRTRILKDITLTITASTLVLIPGYIYFIYRNHSAHEKWQISAIPTFLGPVDPRRFGTVTIFGFGRFATNSLHKKLSMGKLVPSVVLDVWDESVVFFPKDVFRDCSELLGGSSAQTESIDAIFE